MGDINQKTILLVEDDVLIAMMGKMELEKTGYKIIHAKTGEEAVNIVSTENKKIDLIIMDIDLGKGIDGTEAAKEILKDHTIPVLFLSSHTEKEIVEKTENISSYGYVVKNSCFTVLDASIKMAFKLFEAKQDLQNQFSEINDLYNNAPCGYHSVDQDGIFQRINNTELNWLGYDREELVGKKKLTDLLTPGSLEVFNRNFPGYKQKGYINNLELDCLRKNDSILPVLFTSIIINNSEGNYLMSRSTITDNTERKEAELLLNKSQHELEVHQIELEMQNHELRTIQAELGISKAHYFDLYELAPVGYLTVNEKGLILESNLTLAALLGVARSNLAMKPFNRFIFKNDQDLYYLHFKKLFETKEPQSCALNMVKHDGDIFRVRLEAKTITNDSGEGLCHVAVSNITERVQSII